MNIEERIERRKRMKEAERKEKEQQAIREIVHKACARASEGVKSGAITPRQLTPAQQIRALEAYIDDMKEIASDLNYQYGKYASKEIRLIEVQIGWAISAIASLRIEMIKPNNEI